MGKRGATLRPLEAPAIWSCNPRERYASEEKSPRSAGLPRGHARKPPVLTGSRTAKRREYCGFYRWRGRITASSVALHLLDGKWLPQRFGVRGRYDNVVPQIERVEGLPAHHPKYASLPRLLSSVESWRDRAAGTVASLGRHCARLLRTPRRRGRRPGSARVSDQGITNASGIDQLL
jgi:hypothetical protein